MSPFLMCESSGTILPLTFAPTQWWPTSVCTWYAKSSGVADAGIENTSPFGEKMNTCVSNRSSLRFSMNMRESRMSFCHSSSERSQVSFWPVSSSLRAPSL